jgi:hypothetical protein
VHTVVIQLVHVPGTKLPPVCVYALATDILFVAESINGRGAGICLRYENANQLCLAALERIPGRRRRRHDLQFDNIWHGLRVHGISHQLRARDINISHSLRVNNNIPNILDNGHRGRLYTAHQGTVHCNSWIDIPRPRFQIYNINTSTRVKNKQRCFTLDLGAPAPLRGVVSPTVIHRSAAAAIGVPHGTSSVLWVARRVGDSRGLLQALLLLGGRHQGLLLALRHLRRALLLLSRRHSLLLSLVLGQALVLDAQGRHLDLQGGQRWSSCCGSHCGRVASQKQVGLFSHLAHKVDLQPPQPGDQLVPPTTILT